MTGPAKSTGAKVSGIQKDRLDEQDAFQDELNWDDEPDDLDADELPEYEPDETDADDEDELEVIYLGGPYRQHLPEEADAEEGPVHAERPNKSAGKRTMQSLQSLADRLLQLGPGHWQSLGLSDRLQQALHEGRRLTSLSARRRQQRYLAKLLSLEERQAAIDLVQTLDAKHEADNLRFHRLEQWRERLLTEGDTALAELLHQHPHADRQTLRQLMRQAQKEASSGKPPAAARKLFKVLRTLDTQGEDGAD